MNPNRVVITIIIVAMQIMLRVLNIPLPIPELSTGKLFIVNLFTMFFVIWEISPKRGKASYVGLLIFQIWLTNHVLTTI